MEKLKLCQTACIAILIGHAGPLLAQENNAQNRLAAASKATIGGPSTAQAQQEIDRLRRLEDSRWPWLDRTLDPLEAEKELLRKRTGLSLSFDYQTLYQHSTETTTGVSEGAAGQARILGNWTLADREGSNPGSFVFILENRHKLGLDQTPTGLAGEIGYVGLTGLTFGDTGNSLSVAYWSQAILEGGGGVVVGRIDPGDYTDILGYVNPRTTFQNFSIFYNPVIPVPDPGFGVGLGAFLNDQVYVVGMASDANGSLTEVEWFPGGSEYYKYAEIGWTPGRDQRYLTNVHLGVYHVDARTDAGVPSSKGVLLSASKTFDNDLMLFGRLGWSDGAAPIAERAATAGLMWRPGFYDDLIGFAINLADPVDRTLDQQTTVEAFYRLDVSDNLAITADVQYLKNPGFGSADPLVFGLRMRLNL